MTTGTLLLLITLPIFADSQQCRYEFTVPETNALKCSALTDKLDTRVSHLETEIEYGKERSNSIASTLSKELSKIVEDTINIRNKSKSMGEEIAELKTTTTSLMRMEREVERLKDVIQHTNDSLVPKFIDLQSKMFDIAHDMQTKSAEQMSRISDIQQQLYAQQQLLTNLSTAVKDLQSTLTSLQTMESKLHIIETQQKNQTEREKELVTRIRDLEEVTASIPDQIKHLNSASGLMQGLLMNSLRTMKAQLRTLNADVNSLKSSNLSKG